MRMPERGEGLGGEPGRREGSWAAFSRPSPAARRGSHGEVEELLLGILQCGETGELGEMGLEEEPGEES